MNDGTRLTPDDPARERYEVLCVSLGGEPAEAHARAVLARLCAWSDAEDVSQLAHLIRRARRQAVAACRALLAEVVEHLRSTHRDAMPQEYVYTALPIGLVSRIRDTASEGGWDRG